jgi:hypothetical protein
MDYVPDFPSNEDVSWEQGSGSIVFWFPGGDPVGFDRKPKHGALPVNPYSGEPYTFSDA